VTYGLFVWPCAPLLAKYVFYREDTVAHKHVLEVSAQTLMYFFNCFEAFLLEFVNICMLFI